MKSLVVPAAGQLEFAEIPRPTPGEYQALVRMEACGFCNSTDHKLVEGTMFWAPPFPIILGHESVGRVVEIGSKVTNLAVGDLVTRPIYIAPPGGCEYAPASGGFAEYGVVHDLPAMLANGDRTLEDDYAALRQMVLPQGLSAVEGALAISLSETASVLAYLPNVRHKTVLVAGTGVVGLAFCLWLKMAGARVIVLGRREERLEKALAIGADLAVNTTEQDWLDQVRAATSSGHVEGMIEATGDAKLAKEMIELLATGGFASAYGVPPTGVDYPEPWVASRVEEHLSFHWVADLLRRGWIDSKAWISHQWPFAQALEGYEAVTSGKVFKGFVTFPQDLRS